MPILPKMTDEGNMSLRLINLLRGWPAPSLLPSHLLQNAAKQILNSTDTAVPALQYAPDEGPLALRNALSKFLSSFYNRSVTIDRICTTGGASQNLGVTLAAFSDPAYTRAVWAVEPTYFLACRIFNDAGVKVHGFPDGERGVDVVELRRLLEKVEKDRGGSDDVPKYKPLPRPWPTKIYKHIIYTVPSFSNPTGRTMTLSARQDLVRLARAFDALIICDDVYDCLYWSTTSKDDEPETLRAVIPRIVDVDATLDGGTHRDGADGFGNVLSNASFSKIVAPGIRTGWVEATPELAYALSQAGSNRSGGAASNLTGEFVGNALASGELQNHIKRVLIPAYARRWRKMCGAVETYLTHLGVSTPYFHTRLGDLYDVDDPNFTPGNRGDEYVAGGYFIWIKLPNGISADLLTDRTKEEENLIVAAESVCRVPRADGKKDAGHDEYIRLCFAWVDEENLVESVKRLSITLNRMLENDESGSTRNGAKIDSSTKRGGTDQFS